MPALVDKTTLRIRASPSFCAEGGGDPLADMMWVDCAWGIEDQFNGKSKFDNREAKVGRNTDFYSLSSGLPIIGSPYERGSPPIVSWAQ